MFSTALYTACGETFLFQAAHHFVRENSEADSMSETPGAIPTASAGDTRGGALALPQSSAPARLSNLPHASELPNV